MVKKFTRKSFTAWAEALGMEIEVFIPAEKYNHWTGDLNNYHVHAYSADNTIFKGCDTHNLSLWESPNPPDWTVIAENLGSDPLEPCEDPECDVCYGGEPPDYNE